MKPLVFIHIPKAGGKSFELLLRSNYPDDSKVIRLYRTGGQELDGVFEKVPRYKIEQAELIYGHIPHRIEQYIGRSCEYTSILRNPVERLISFYRYVKYDFDKHPLHTKLNSGEIGMIDLLSEDNFELNKMTKLLAGIDIREPPAIHMLSVAKSNLEKMKAFGLLEKYEESCLLISKVFHWTHPFYMKVNSTSDTGKSEIFEERILERIAEANDLDMQLYEYAQTLFAQRVEVEGDAFAHALRSYQVLQHGQYSPSAQNTTVRDESFDSVTKHQTCVHQYLDAVT